MAGASQHVVSGILDCGQASGWTDGGVVLNQVHYPYGKKITLNFKQPYDTPPTVFLSVASITIFNTDSRDGRDSYGTGLLEVTTTGFTMACGVYATSRDDSEYTYVFELQVNWLSVST